VNSRSEIPNGIGTMCAPFPRARVRARIGDRGRIAIRTKFFDDAVVSAISGDHGGGGGWRRRRRQPPRPWQVVLLGAGLDTRAWRLSPARGAPPARAVFEMDVPEVLEHKRAAMTKRVHTTAKHAKRLPPPPPLTLGSSYREVPANFAEPGWDQKLRAAGHDRGAPTVWVLEGLLYYLSPAAVNVVLRRTAAASAPGSVLVASVVNRASVARAKRGPQGGAKAGSRRSTHQSYLS